jgi:hypothetical protein
MNNVASYSVADKNVLIDVRQERRKNDKRRRRKDDKRRRRETNDQRAIRITIITIATGVPMMMRKQKEKGSERARTKEN